MKFRYKIKRGLDLIKNFYGALILEPKRHPWRLIFTELLYHTFLANLLQNDYKEKLKRKLLYEYGTSFIEKIKGNYIVINNGLFKIFVKNEEKYLIIIGWEFLELIYPYITKYPIKLWGDPYENKFVSLKKGDTVIDAGANIGIFTIFAAKKVGPYGKVFSFEPSKEVRELLTLTIKINNIHNIIVEPYALGEKNGEMVLFLSKENPARSSGIFDLGGVKEIVKQITLDEYVKKNNIEKVDFIKVDIEGMERNFLRGAEETIKKFKPRIAICYYHLPDDYFLLEKIIKEFVPEYKIIKSGGKLYAWC